MRSASSQINLAERETMQTISATSPGAPPSARHTFPDPAITLVEFSDQGLGVLLAAHTERDAANRRIVLKKVAYIHLEKKGWGACAFPEIWVQQNQEGIFLALEPQGGKIFRHPSRRRYEVAFLSKELFDCGIQCIKEHQPEPIYELIVVLFASRPGFSVESGFLLAPDDYAGETEFTPADQWVATPPPLGARTGRS
jgi:hypothetical protein